MTERGQEGPYMGTRKGDTFTFMHLAHAFIQSDLQYTFRLYNFVIFFVSMCVPWELNPQHLRC